MNKYSYYKPLSDVVRHCDAIVEYVDINDPYAKDAELIVQSALADEIANLESRLAEAERKPACWHMTGGEIRDLCAFAGFTVMEADPDMMETEYTIQTCPESGLYDPDDGKWTRYKQIVSLTEYPEEGSSGLGPVINGGGN